MHAVVAAGSPWPQASALQAQPSLPVKLWGLPLRATCATHSSADAPLCTPPAWPVSASCIAAHHACPCRVQPELCVMCTNWCSRGQLAFTSGLCLCRISHQDCCLLCFVGPDTCCQRPQGPCRPHSQGTFSRLCYAGQCCSALPSPTSDASDWNAFANCAW